MAQKVDEGGLRHGGLLRLAVCAIPLLVFVIGYLIYRTTGDMTAIWVTLGVGLALLVGVTVLLFKARR